MKQRITDIVKTFGENDGICSRIYIDGFKHDGWDILSVAWSYEDENLLVFLQDENDRYTNTEWFDSLPYLTQIQICADIENCFGIKFDTISKENVFDDMRNILKDRDDKMVWFADDKCVLHQYYYGTIEKMFVVSVRLVKNLKGEDMILQDVDYCEDGSSNPIRIIDDVMHLSFKEMQELYELMLKNI